VSDVQNPQPDFSGSGAVEYNPDHVKSRGPLELLLSRQEAQLLAIQGVTSVGISIGPTGGEALAVGVVDAGVAARLPHAIEGVPVVVSVTGPVDAQTQR
jgi:hypothetical protein